MTTLTGMEDRLTAAPGEQTIRAIDPTMFESARRHSRRVRLFKLALPALGVAIALGFLAYSWALSPSIVGIDVDGAAIRDGKLVMANPKLDGFNGENLPYSMTAARAIQDLSATGTVLLEEIDAKVPVSEGNFALIEAATGVFDNDANRLDITSPLTVRTSDGMVAKLASARIDIGAGELRTDDPVDIEMDGSRIGADRFEVLERGKVFVFESRVRMTIQPDAASPRKDAGEN